MKIVSIPLLSKLYLFTCMCMNLVFTEKYCTANGIEKLPGPRDWVQILQDQIKLARRRLKRGENMTQREIHAEQVKKKER